jgi:hypothetical protein
MNDTTENTAPEIQANYDANIEMRPYKFSFKTVVLKDDDGKEIGKSKRPTVELNLPVPSVQGLIQAIEVGGTQLALLQEAAENIILARAREIINEREDVSQENFPFDLITWEAIANMPASEKRGRGIPKETWDEFSVDYISVMPALTGKTEKQISAAAEILLDKFNKLKTNRDYKKIVRLLLDQLAIYINNSANAETYMECVTFLTEKGNKILTAEEVSIIDSL